MKSHENPKRKLAVKLKPALGWREWAALPDLHLSQIKAKVDTGAKTSSLHAFDVEVERRHGQDMVVFKVYPIQRNSRRVVHCEAKLEEWRWVTDSGGKRTLRPVILTTMILGDVERLIELTLISRDEMGFRMLIGREAIRRGWVVDPARSFVTIKGKKATQKNGSSTTSREA